MNKIRPFLWFDTQAEEAARFYVSIFENSRLGRIARYPEGGPAPAGSVMTVEFELEGQSYVALNGGPHFRFTEAISLSIDCKSQEEVDYFWSRLTADGGRASQCGWLEDRFGLCWQVTPSRLGELLSDPDPETAKRVMNSMLQMKKIDGPTLERAAAGG